MVHHTVSLKSEGLVFLEREIAAFMARNLIVEHMAKPQVCERCLKAHLLQKCDRLGIERKIVHMLFSCEAGHNGYYLDDEDVVRCD